MVARREVAGVRSETLIAGKTRVGEAVRGRRCPTPAIRVRESRDDSAHHGLHPSKKAPLCGAFSKRLKGLEPSTFCMAKTPHLQGKRGNRPAGGRFRGSAWEPDQAPNHRNLRTFKIDFGSCANWIWWGRVPIGPRPEVCSAQHASQRWRGRSVGCVLRQRSRPCDRIWQSPMACAYSP
jgi:hypothetical protein